MVDEAKRIHHPPVEPLRLFHPTMKFATQQTVPGVQEEVPRKSVGWTFFNNLLKEIRVTSPLFFLLPLALREFLPVLASTFENP
ncbi:MAG: hypothetical protein CSYNP_00618 [Syntrophus sp. SKADARSKE-3]|nr:hypothetical protein [Syntrophus sp. SKADARSKE-3]